jgi:branched-chain amino acid transport system ATP-binding protein
LVVEGVSVRYGGVHVLRDVSLSVTPGEVVALVGANGAGKTTLLDTVSGLVRLESGSVAFAGRDITAMPADARARLGITRSFQNVRLFSALTVRETIAVALEQHVESKSALLAAFWSPMTRAAERRVARRVDNLIESLGLVPFAGKFVNELSTGTRRVLDMACVMATAPKLLLLDEPSAGLAQAETELLAPLVGRIVKETGCGVLMIEHDLALASSLADSMVALHLGEVLAHGTPSEVLADSSVRMALVGIDQQQAQPVGG